MSKAPVMQVGYFDDTVSPFSRSEIIIQQKARRAAAHCHPLTRHFFWFWIWT